VSSVYSLLRGKTLRKSSLVTSTGVDKSMTGVGNPDGAFGWRGLVDLTSLLG
jgi:hypothetical protein